MKVLKYKSNYNLKFNSPTSAALLNIMLLLNPARAHTQKERNKEIKKERNTVLRNDFITVTLLSNSCHFTSYMHVQTMGSL